MTTRARKPNRVYGVGSAYPNGAGGVAFVAKVSNVAGISERVTYVDLTLTDIAKIIGAIPAIKLDADSLKAATVLIEYLLDNKTEKV